MRAVAALALAVLLLAGGAGCTGDEPPRDRTLAGELVTGGRYEPAAHRDKVTVVNFWGSWCAPCRAEMPELIAAYEALRGDGVAFLGINVKDPDRDKARAFLDNYRVPYPSIFDPASKLALAFDVPPSTIPATLIVRPDGTVAAEYRKALRRDELTDAVRKVLADG